MCCKHTSKTLTENFSLEYAEKWQSPNSKKCLKIKKKSSASIIISMFDLHTVHLKCFCSFMCPLNVFQTYIKNFNRKPFPGGRHTQDRRTDRQKAHPLCLASPPGRDKNGSPTHPFTQTTGQPRWLSGLRRSRVHSLVIARRSLCPEKLGSNPGQGSKGINFSGWHGLDMSITVTKRR